MLVKVFIFILSLTTIIVKSEQPADYGYHNYARLTAILNQYAQNFPSKTYLYSIGKSVQGRELWVLAISDNNPSQHVILRPDAKYIGNMHGNEVPSKEVLIHLIDYMLNNQATDPSVDFIMKNTRVHIMPSMNPDGFEMSTEDDCDSVDGRYNANNIDLNRDFPDLFETNTFPTQPETQHVMNWLNNNSFILSANLHGGSLVVNYPYDNYKGSNGIPRNNPSADNDVFRKMAFNYSFNNPAMKAPATCTEGEPSFDQGITNGAAWYPVRGGMQDYNYWKFGCMEVTLEISCCKYPNHTMLNQIWLQNQKSLIDYLKFANTGVRGVVKFNDGTIAQNVTIRINSRDPVFTTNSNGEYFRILLPGTYTLWVLFGCKPIYNTTITIPSTGHQLLQHNVNLDTSLLQAYQNSKLNRYASFCGNIKTFETPVDASSSIKLSASTSMFFLMVILSCSYNFIKVY